LSKEISPILTYNCYFFNICVLHNLQNTFSMESRYHSRIKKYSTVALMTSILILIITTAYLNINGNFMADFIAIFYGIGIIMLGFILYKVLYLATFRETYFSYFAGNWNEINKKGLLVKLFNRHLIFLSFFLICFLPNNLIQLFKALNSEMHINGLISNISIYLISLSPVFTFLNKFTERSMLKYYHKCFFFIYKVDVTYYLI
jgi:hypothetical protein